MASCDNVGNQFEDIKAHLFLIVKFFFGLFFYCAIKGFCNSDHVCG